MYAFIVGLAVWCGLAHASPNRVAWTNSQLSEAIDLAPGPSGLVVVMADPTGGSLASLDLRTWDLTELSTCTGSVGAGVWAGTDETRVYTGCDDGTVTWATLSDGSLVATGSSVDVGDGAVLGVTVLDDVVFVLTQPTDGSNPTLHTIDPSSDALDDASGYPSTLSHSGYQDIDNNGSYLVVLHGGDNLSKVDPSTGNAVIEDRSLGVLDGVDLVTQTSGSSVYGAGGAAVARYDLSGNDWSLYLGSGDGLVDVDAICLLEDDAQLLVADGGAGTVKLFSYDSGSNALGDTVEDSWSYPSSGAVVSEAVSAGGGVVAGTTDGELWVMTGGPWVELSTVDPTSVVAGDTVSLTFQTDSSGSYTVRVGSDTDGGGTVLAKGDVDAATDTTVDLEVGDSFAEGDNQVRVVVTDSASQSGHDAAVVSVDNPPARITLSQDNIGVADGYLVLSLNVPDATDITTVQVYVTVTAFSRDDWAEGGGPDFDGEDALPAGALQFAVSPSEAAELVISPLTNNVTYYLAVRAIDSGGLEGPMSTVVTGMPELTLGLADLTGDQGGFCGTPGTASLGLSLLGLGLAVVRRRRRRFAAGTALLLAVGLASMPAQADDSDEAQPQVLSNTQVRVGPMIFADGNAIKDVLGDGGHNIVWLETGPSWRGLAQLTMGVGFYRKKGTLLTESGATSSQQDLLWAVPLTANLALRLDIVDEQILVPYFTGGLDLWMWREQRKLEDGTSSGVGGGKWGYHYGAGGQLLLDVFDRGRAGLAFTRLGIKDTYLTGEWRRQDIGVFQDGIDLSNDQVTFGISLHY